MATVKRFEDLTVWQSARELVTLVYKKSGKSQFSKDFALRDQIRRAAISVMSNVAEGFDAGYDGEFIRFLGFSFRSAAEVQSQLYAALDLGYIDNNEVEVVYGKGVDVRKQIRSLVAYLSENRRSGHKAREGPSSYMLDDDENFVELVLPESFTTLD